MALIKCDECGKDISDTVEKCIHCGYPIKKPCLIKVIYPKTFKLFDKKLEIYFNDKLIKEVWSGSNEELTIDSKGIVLFRYFLFEKELEINLDEQYEIILKNNALKIIKEENWR